VYREGSGWFAAVFFLKVSPFKRPGLDKRRDEAVACPPNYEL
jgi:hypothetical protein